MKEMLAAALQESEEALHKQASGTEEKVEAPASEQKTETKEQAENIKLASADLLTLADQLDEVADQLTKEASVQGSAMSQVLAKLAVQNATRPPKGSAAPGPAYHPQAQTNMGTFLKGKEPKKDKSRLSNIPMAPPMESVNKLETNVREDAAVHQETPDNILKTSAERRQKIAAIAQRVMRKLAGEDVSSAKIGAPKATRNLADEAAPAQPQQGDRSLISSNEAATRYTKRQAKATPKKVLKDVLQEPALSKATDSKLQENLVNTGAAGVKISSAQRSAVLGELQKVASRVGSPEHAWLNQQVHRFREKRAAAARSRESIRGAVEKASFFNPGTSREGGEQ
jgi:hypothetical protein